MPSVLLSEQEILNRVLNTEVNALQVAPSNKSTIQEVFTDKAATGVGTTIDVSGYNSILVQVTAALNSTLTYKFQGSVADSAPDFSSARTESNVWEYIHAYDLQNPSSGIPGDTGVSITNDTVANNVYLYKINVDMLHWFNIEVSAYTDGDVTAKVFLANV